MRSPGVVLSLAVIAVAVAACGSDDPEQTGPTPTGGATGGPTGGGSTGVAECVVGDWRSTGTEGEVGGGPVTATTSSGDGVSLSVGADGATRVDFTEMQPVTIDGEAAGAAVAGELTYAGEASGTIQTDTGTDAGTWEPVETADWSGVTVTVNLSEPVAGTPVDDAPIGDVIEQADEVTGEIVDVEPMLGEGRFECDGETLILSPTEGEGGMTWTLTRA
jgi:hypothetical protein